MAATKHSIADSDEPDCASRPVKKSKTVDNGELGEKARLKKEKSEKKGKKEDKKRMEEKRKSEVEVETAIDEKDEATVKAEKKARKEEKKKRKAELKEEVEAETTANSNKIINDDKDEAIVKAEKKARKEEKNKRKSEVEVETAIDDDKDEAIVKAEKKARKEEKKNRKAEVEEEIEAETTANSNQAIDDDDKNKAIVKAEKKARKEEKKKRKADVQVETNADSNQVVDDKDEAATSKAEKKARKEEKKKGKEAKNNTKHELKPESVAEQETAKLHKEEKEKEEKKKGKEAKNITKHELKPESAAEEETAKLNKEKKEKKEKKKGKPATAAVSNNASYQQTAALSNVPQADIDAFLKKEQIVTTDPNNTDADSPLRPIIEFAHLPPSELLTKKCSPFSKYTTPTPIQAASWPFTLSGRDVVGVAETGSGKTMAFALPCVQAVAARAANERGTTKAVIVSPTRELAMQTHEQLSALAALANLGCVCLYGGASKDEQRALLARGAEIVVATPGRLCDFMADETVSLARCRFAVLDEADRMLDKGFEDDIRRILGSCPPRDRRQTLMFTATWPASVQALASSFMVDPVKVAIGGGGRETESGAVELQANARITQRVQVVESAEKEARLLQLVRKHQQGARKDDRILVFCLYKKEATRVENFLGRNGIRVGGIHGDLRQEQRTRSLEAFKLGQTPVLVATDVAARGLDIPEVKLVINVTFPLTIEDYVHRIGRTGRAGKTGEAITFFTTQDKAHSGSLVNILKGANQPVPDELLKFGTTVKKKAHDMYGSFFKDVDMNQKATKITFD